VNAERRQDIVRNHDATHLLQAALRKILGEHVEQRGSVVEPDRLRFDFSHPQPLTREEIRAVEDLVNRKILEDVPIEKMEVPLAKAQQMGALMFFGEKYGDPVRVVRTLDGFSVELCGGCHGKRTSQIGYFKIASEGSIGAGVRRIEAVTGRRAVEAATRDDDVLAELSAILRAPKGELITRARQLADSVRELERAAEQARRMASEGSVDEIVRAAKAIGPERLVLWDMKEEQKPDALRSLMDVLIKKRNMSAAMLVGRIEGKPFAILGVRPDLVAKGLKAGAAAKEIAERCGGSGGGKDHLAQFGMSDPSMIPVAFEELHRRLLFNLQGPWV
jgi:alanyl-tRNA synthetase